MYLAFRSSASTTSSQPGIFAIITVGFVITTHPSKQRLNTEKQRYGETEEFGEIRNPLCSSAPLFLCVTLLSLSFNQHVFQHERLFPLHRRRPKAQPSLRGSDGILV